MFHPISLNVLRQSLRLSNLPAWLKIQPISCEVRKPGCVIASYVAVFGLSEWCDAVHRYEDITGRYSTSWQELFLSAFSSDVQVADVDANFKDNTLTVTFTTALGKRDRNVKL